jgi:3''-Phosphoadenosine 5''-phosphosulfate (PAPS) 3''-phosphatase
MTSRSHGDDTRLADLLDKNQYRIASLTASGSSIKGCLLAEGVADIYYRFGYTMEWDTAAMQCVCEEAGAVFMQCDGTPLTYNRRNSLNEKGFYILNKPENKFD